MKHQQIVRSQGNDAEGPEVVRLEINLPDQANELVRPPMKADCEVIEFDPESGDAAWKDSVYVQDFTDSVLQTLPAPLTD